MELNGSIVNPDLIYTGDSIKISGNKSAKKVNKSNKMGAKANASTTGYAHPLNMPGAPVSSEFGYRQDPTGMSGTQHDGIDLAVASGTPVYAVKSGTVVEAGFHYSAGNYVIIKHQNGQYTYYFHLSSINTYTGQQVGQLTHIGNVGTTGYSTGSHLHFGISSALWSGFENPRNYVAF
ncbi:M23 family metallopeptidase [Vagococcus zengguangii]|uniref:M23 family metallopeptidase n=2 Tax=Vagococcus zengguangii TaxID=2571750 RepID=A0A4D7CVQ6_9ENTE|nr:M23 family metallopeptidase [Vagococcus zengguangii]TLG78294.1 M23 family metallopeptidase [Vagococcus zengguangii]